MKNSGTILRFSMGAILLLPWTTPAAAESLSRSEYQRQLQQFSARVDQLKDHPENARQLEADVTRNVSVTDNGHEYSFSYEWLTSDLEEFQKAKEANARSAVLKKMREHLQLLQDQAESYERGADFQQYHSKIEEILHRHEFRRAHGPSFLAIWWAKVLRAISRFFDRHRIGRSAGDFLHILVYVAVGIAFILFVIWIKRRLVHAQEELPREIVPFAPSAKGWRTWLGEARTSAQRGAWREAIHLAYWAGVSALEEQGAWRPDRARTPREYLRILGTRKPQYPMLSALTRKFEVIWYGNREASADDFQEALGQLEKLGCR